MSDPVTAGAIIKVASTGGSIAKMAVSIATGFSEYKAKKEKEWWESVVSNFQGRSVGETEAEVERRLHDLATRENALKAMSLSWRYLLESVDDSVLPALAAITAEYLALDKLPDAFYRDVCRTLSDLSYLEFMDLKQLCTGLVGILSKLEERGISVQQFSIRRDNESGMIEARAVGGSGAPTTAERMPWVDSYGRLLQMLNSYGIGHPSTGWGGQLLSFLPETLRHLDKMINP